MKTHLRTPRLRLDPVAPADVLVLHSHWIEPEVREFLWDGRVIDRDEVEEVVRTSDRLFDEHGAGLWAIRSPDGGFLGCVGFWHFHEPPELELVVSLSPAVWGLGMAKEACGAVIGHAFDSLGRTAVQASTDAPNERSLNLIRSLGMEPAGQRPGAFGPTYVFRADR